MKKIAALTLLLIMQLVIICGCGASQPDELQKDDNSGVVQEEQMSDKELIMKIDGKTVPVEWEDNESAAALRELAAGGLEISASRYGGFEQVGDLGTSLPRNDKSMNAGPGDIMLYSGSSIVVFYGSNSWAYTRLGKIGLSEEEMNDLLGKGGVTISLSLE